MNNNQVVARVFTENEHTVFIVIEKGDVLRTHDFSQDPPDWHVVKRAEKEERFMDMHIRGGRAVLISDTTIYTIDDILADELQFETFAGDSQHGH
jgi:hypothetical protein